LYYTYKLMNLRPTEGASDAYARSKDSRDRDAVSSGHDGSYQIYGYRFILKDKPESNPWLWLVHVFNLFFLLAVNTTVALLLATGHMETVDPTRLDLGASWFRTAIEIGGMGLYVMGFLLMEWALASLGRNYQAGGSSPRASDSIVLTGPYHLMRHPMYAAAMFISSGLACMVESLALFSVFLIYLALILLLIPFEEKRLQQAYGEPYSAYQKTVKKIIPHLY
jgi:protein-S-isoprenylcysteine O-methyltransferase Ste14